MVTPPAGTTTVGKNDVRPSAEARREPSSTPAPPAATPAIAAPVVAPSVTSGNQKIVALPLPPTQSVAPVGDLQARTAIQRAEGWLKAGNVANARALLADAAKGENSDVVAALAETYDPIALQRYPRLAGQADATRAVELYSQAAAKGSDSAKERLKALQAFMQKAR